jgi:hypothetical protein
MRRDYMFLGNSTLSTFDHLFSLLFKLPFTSLSLFYVFCNYLLCHSLTIFLTMLGLTFALAFIQWFKVSVYDQRIFANALNLCFTTRKGPVSSPTISTVPALLVPLHILVTVCTFLVNTTIFVAKTVWVLLSSLFVTIKEFFMTIRFTAAVSVFLYSSFIWLYNLCKFTVLFVINSSLFIALLAISQLTVKWIQEIPGYFKLYLLAYFIYLLLPAIFLDSVLYEGILYFGLGILLISSIFLPYIVHNDTKTLFSHVNYDSVLKAVGLFFFLAFTHGLLYFTWVHLFVVFEVMFMVSGLFILFAFTMTYGGVVVQAINNSFTSQTRKPATIVSASSPSSYSNSTTSTSGLIRRNLNTSAGTATPFIPWVETQNIAKARGVIANMLASLPQDSPLYKFLAPQVQWLLVPLTGNTRIAALGSDSFPPICAPVVVKGNVLRIVRSVASGKAGCYVFINSITHQVYIGSALDFLVRFKSHLTSSKSSRRRGSTELYKSALTHSWSNFTWQPVVIVTNYHSNYLTENLGSVSAEEQYILRSFVQFEARIHEQALFNYYKPSLNTSLIVNFPFMNWTPDSKLEAMNITVPLTATTVEGDLTMTFDSINQASNLLGIPHTSLVRHKNLINHPVNSPVFGPVFIVDSSMPLSEERPTYHNTSHLESISDFDLESLAPNFLYAYLADKETLFGTYISPSDAARLLDNKSDNKYIRRYINLERLVLVGPEKTPVYFVMNPTYKENSKARSGRRQGTDVLKKPVKMLDHLSGESVEFTSLAKVLEFIGKDPKATHYINKYLDKGIKYLGRYEFTRGDKTNK